MKKLSFPIIILSFLLLFLELSLIRYLPAHIRYLGYFNNLVLIASFFGIGIGFLLARIKLNLLLFFPLVLFGVIVLTKIVESGVNINSTQLIFFGDDTYTSFLQIPPVVFLPLVFVSIASVFACLAQGLGRLFKQTTSPNLAYISDILGSIFGILIFSLLSFLSTPAWLWFIIFVGVFFFIYPKKPIYIVLAVISFSISILVSADIGSTGIYWSPYYRINLILSEDGTRGEIFANNIIHQSFTSTIFAPGNYALVYRRFFLLGPPKNVLIIGAGSGQDVSAALKAGVDHVDAVDIDPVILKIGKTFHPEKPYDDTRVTIFNNDGRNYLKTTNKKYDLVIFALTDSLIVSSTGANIRLESFLFTKEGFEEARAHLNPGGAFILYNDYRQPWLIERLQNMLTEVFGKVPQVGIIGESGRLFYSKNDPNLPEIKTSAILPTDDWPFFYLRKHNIPGVYISTLIVILLLSSFSIGFISIKLLPRNRINLPRLGTFLLLGAAFSLLETKSMVQLNLLFGTTWIVNSLAFLGVLLSVLAAAIVTLKFQIKKPILLLTFLAISLVLQYFIPTAALMVPNLILRFLLACLFFYLPIFFANLIFTNLFAKSENPELDFGANLLGLVLGGVLEYSVLIIGYSQLTSVVGALYLFATILLFLNSRHEKLL